jgi:hypothetical protein
VLVEIVSALVEIVPALLKMVSALVEIVSALVEIVSALVEIVSALVEIMSALVEIVSRNVGRKGFFLPTSYPLTGKRHIEEVLPLCNKRIIPQQGNLPETITIYAQRND